MSLHVKMFRLLVSSLVAIAAVAIGPIACGGSSAQQHEDELVGSPPDKREGPPVWMRDLEKKKDETETADGEEEETSSSDEKSPQPSRSSDSADPSRGE